MDGAGWVVLCREDPGSEAQGMILVPQKKTLAEGRVTVKPGAYAAK